MEKIISFFEKQPFTKFYGNTVMTEWFPISDRSKIKLLEELGYKINIEQTHVRNEQKIRNKSKVIGK